jgi:hypothetical protein
MTDQLADPELAAFLKDFYARPAPPAAQLGAAAMRAGAAQRVAARPPGPPLSVTDLTAPPGGRPALPRACTGRTGPSRRWCCSCTAAAS